MIRMFFGLVSIQGLPPSADFASPESFIDCNWAEMPKARKLIKSQPNTAIRIHLTQRRPPLAPLPRPGRQPLPGRSPRPEDPNRLPPPPDPERWTS